MMPGMVGQLMSYADVQYRQQELARQFSQGRAARSRRALRRASRAQRAGRSVSTVQPAPAGAAGARVAGPASRTVAPVPQQTAANSASPVLDERLPVA